jgi:hypothetical protein
MAVKSETNYFFYLAQNNSEGEPLLRHRTNQKNLK